MWDVIVITTYLTISVLFLYFPLLADLPILIKNSKDGSARQKFYKIIGSFWKGTAAQFRISENAIKIISVMIIPVALAIHTVTSWLFATTYRPGWDSTNFGAYFVSGAFLVGAGGVVVAMYVFRKAYHLEAYITEKHFNNMSKIVVLLALVYLYFNINEYLVPCLQNEKGRGTSSTEFGYWRIRPLVLDGHHNEYDRSSGGVVIPQRKKTIPCFFNGHRGSGRFMV